ncbi:MULTISPECIES: hypothetical protein [unclassified Methylobacterium]|uniref:hypothetical protein n=1 Tax=unclassified Methylobacterium TaxID=2615210 RepID=UPI0005BA1420|nr:MULTISPECIES: hypothetical protein [unclassified Methylobacterium]SFU50580.1 hypothetical protein SAMN02799643_00961 [Methylobacterium sp. UNCCL125]
MRRSFWVIYWGVSLLWLLTLFVASFGARIEATFAPVRIEQRVEAVSREAGRLCWSSVALKVRDKASDDVDVYVRVAGGERLVASVYHADTLMPWRASAAPRPGPVSMRYCLTLPPHVHDADPVEVEWQAWYPGLLNLWRIGLVMPHVLSPGTAP